MKSVSEITGRRGLNSFPLIVETSALKFFSTKSMFEYEIGILSVIFCLTQNLRLEIDGAFKSWYNLQTFFDFSISLGVNPSMCWLLKFKIHTSVGVVESSLTYIPLQLHGYRDTNPCLLVTIKKNSFLVFMYTYFF